MQNFFSNLQTDVRYAERRKTRNFLRDMGITNAANTSGGLNNIHTTLYLNDKSKSKHDGLQNASNIKNKELLKELLPVVERNSPNIPQQ